MAKIVDILVTGSDKHYNLPYQNQIIVKVKKTNEIKYYTSSSSGFHCEYYLPYSPDRIEQYIEDTKPISLIKGTDKTYPVYIIDDDYVAIINNQYVCLKTEGSTGNKKIVGAYCNRDAAYEDKDAYRSYHDISKFDLAEIISKDLAKQQPRLKIKLKNEDEPENE